MSAAIGRPQLSDSCPLARGVTSYYLVLRGLGFEISENVVCRETADLRPQAQVPPEFAPRVLIPLLSVVARGDSNILRKRKPARVRYLPAQDKRLAVPSGSAHGVTLIETSIIGTARLARLILLGFAHAPMKSIRCAHPND